MSFAASVERTRNLTRVPKKNLRALVPNRRALPPTRGGTGRPGRGQDPALRQVSRADLHGCRRRSRSPEPAALRDAGTTAPQRQDRASQARGRFTGRYVTQSFDAWRSLSLSPVTPPLRRQDQQAIRVPGAPAGIRVLRAPLRPRSLEPDCPGREGGGAGRPLLGTLGRIGMASRRAPTPAANWHRGEPWPGFHREDYGGRLVGGPVAGSRVTGGRCGRGKQARSVVGSRRLHVGVRPQGTSAVGMEAPSVGAERAVREGGDNRGELASPLRQEPNHAAARGLLVPAGGSGVAAETVHGHGGDVAARQEPTRERNGRSRRRASLQGVALSTVGRPTSTGSRLRRSSRRCPLRTSRGP